MPISMIDATLSRKLAGVSFLTKVVNSKNKRLNGYEIPQRFNALSYVEAGTRWVGSETSYIV